MENYSNAFVLSQYRYYRANLLFRGQGWQQVHGLFEMYQAEARKRGLIKLDTESSTLIEIPEELLS